MKVDGSRQHGIIDPSPLLIKANKCTKIIKINKIVCFICFFIIMMIRIENKKKIFC